MSTSTDTLECNADDVANATRVPHDSDPPRNALESTVALVTGGGRGIGQIVARALAEAGAAVALVSRSVDELNHTVRLIEAAGGTAAAVTADVADPENLAAAVSELQGRLGPIDLLVNNAGIVGPIGPLWEVDPTEWWTTMDVNLRGLVLSSQLVLPRWWRGGAAGSST